MLNIRNYPLFKKQYNNLITLILGSIHLSFYLALKISLKIFVFMKRQTFIFLIVNRNNGLNLNWNFKLLRKIYKKKLMNLKSKFLPKILKKLNLNLMIFFTKKKFLKNDNIIYSKRKFDIISI